MQTKPDSAQEDWRCAGCLANKQVLCTKGEPDKVYSHFYTRRSLAKRSSLSSYEKNLKQIPMDERQHRGTQVPLRTQDFPSKVPDKHNERSCTTTSARLRHSSKMVEIGKVKFIPDEELVTSRAKARVPVSLSRNNQENSMHASVSRRTSRDISLSARSKEFISQEKKLSTMAEGQFSLPKLTSKNVVNDKEDISVSARSKEFICQQKKLSTMAEGPFSLPELTSKNVVNDKEEKLQIYNASGKGLGAPHKKVKLEESVSAKAHDSLSKNVVPTESKSNYTTKPLPNYEERRIMTKASDMHHATSVKEEPMECTKLGVFNSPSNIQPLESKRAPATSVPTNEVAHNQGINKLIGYTTHSDAQINRSAHQKKDLPSTLLIVSDEEHSNYPSKEPLWMGGFEVSDSMSYIYEGIRAHIPSKVSVKVYNMLSQLPERIKFKLLRRIDVWPRAFQLDPPDYDDIGLYFFPCDHHRFKENYIHLLEGIERGDLAMKSCIGDVELIIFTSKQLPNNSLGAGLTMEMFLWGVFRHRRSNKKVRLHGQEQPPAQTLVATCSRSIIKLESNSEVNGVGGVNHAFNPPNLIGGADVGQINIPISRLDTPPGFSEPYIRKIDLERKSYARGKAISPTTSEAPPGFPIPYSWRSGNNSREGAPMGSRFSGEFARDISQRSRAGLVIRDAPASWMAKERP